MATFNPNWNEKQWFAFICGFRAGLTVADLNAPFYRIDTMLQPVGIGGPTERAIVVGNTEYDGDGVYLIPVYTYGMTFTKPMADFSGFTVRIDISDTRLGFIGIDAGSFDQATNLTYQILSGNHLLVQGLRPASYIERDTGDPVDYNLQDLKDYGPLLYSTASSKPAGSSEEMEILFYLRMSVTGGVYSDSPINLPLIYSSGTIDSPNVEDETTTLLTFLKGSDVPGVGINPAFYYMYFVTPILAVGGKILSEIPPISAPLGPSSPVSITSSPSCIYAATVYTPKGWPAVMGLYVNPNPDNLEGATDVEYVQATFLIKSKPDYAITRWQIEAGRGWELQEAFTTTANEDGEFMVYINAKRTPTEVLSGMFAYIVATILFDEEELYIPVIPTQGSIHYTDGGVESD